MNKTTGISLLVAAAMFMSILMGAMFSLRKTKIELDFANQRACYWDSLYNAEIVRQFEEKATNKLQKSEEWSLLAQALIQIESEGVEDAVGDNGRAIGVLQLWPSVVEDVQIAGHSYTLNDRYDREKSIEIWYLWQEIYNPEHDIHKALKLQNPRAPISYHNKVIRRLQILKNQNQ